MKREFITPVSMRCTQEQYERDLKEPLRELGYGYAVNNGFWEEDKAYLTTYINDNSTSVQLYNCKPRAEYIPTYNSEQFLALASMTKGEEPIMGEYIVNTGDNDKDLTIGKLYKVTYNEECDYYTGVRDDVGDSNYIYIDDFRKATKEEIIEHFSKNMKDKKESRFPFELDLEGYKKLDGIACVAWKKRFVDEWAHDLLHDGRVYVREPLYKEMRDACDEEQHKVLDEVFGKDEKSVEEELMRILCQSVSTDRKHDLILQTFNIEFKK